ncbi:galactinol synthase [Kwoniella mangroviensis CBS 8886]|nr:galactinol synthase [Kwoniella mangroviensis CBS 8886]
MAIEPAPILDGRVGGRKAWVTLITNPGYIAGLLTLHRTLISVSSYPLIVMTTSSLSQSSRETITSSGIEIIEVEHLSPSSDQHSGFDPSFSRFNDAWTKIRVFGLEQFERIILIDSDMIFLRGMDELFDLELPGDDWIAASPACVCNPFKLKHYPEDWIPSNCSLSLQNPYTTLSSPPIPSPDSKRTSHLLNSGLVIFKPSLSLLDELVHHLNTSPTIAQSKFADQDVITEVFKGRWKPLPWWCNALKTQRAVHGSMWRDEEVRLIHYILDKPWNHRPSDLPPHPTLPPTPITPSNFTQQQTQNTEKRRPLPPGLLDAVRNTSPQESLTNYDAVHAWWWIVYEDLLGEWKAENKAGWREVDQYVTR